MIATKRATDTLIMLIVLSGLLAAQAGAALAAYRARGLVLAHRIALDGWVTLVLRTPSASLPRKRERASRVQSKLKGSFRS